jgi:hypothetical protein
MWVALGNEPAGEGSAEGNGRGLHSFPFQLNLSSSVHRINQLTRGCVPELLKLSSNVNECKPLDDGEGQEVHRSDHGDQTAVEETRKREGVRERKDDFLVLC